MARGDDDDDNSNDNITALYFDAGPFSDPKEFYLVSIDRWVEPEQPFRRGLQKLLRLFLNWIPEHEGYYRYKFVLTHPDLDIQNVIVSADGHLRGLIDWDGVTAVPRSIGKESYPSWLTRDWDPAMYGWSDEEEEEGGTGIDKPAGLREDSPDTLARHRAEYETFIRSALSTTPSSSSSPSSSLLTAQSLYITNLLIAAENPVCTFGILQKLVDKIRKVVVRKDPIIETNEDNNNNKRSSLSIENFNIFDISESLAAGVLGQQQQIELLRAGFKALLNGTY